MNRTTASALGVALFVLANAACGDKPPPKPPESTTTSDAGETSSTGSDGGETASGDAGAGGETKPPGDTPPPAAASLALPSAAAKLKFKQKKDFDLEVKSDGTVNSGGKPMAKVNGMELQDKDGKAQLKVDADGNVTTSDGAAYAKFEGDDLAALNSAKLNIGEDGAINWTDEKGKKSSLGKAEGVGSAKKTAALVVAYAMWGLKAPAAPAGAKKPGDKPGDKKPGDKKPGDKPAPKK